MGWSLIVSRALCRHGLHAESENCSEKGTRLQNGHVMLYISISIYLFIYLSIHPSIYLYRYIIGFPSLKLPPPPCAVLAGIIVAAGIWVQTPSLVEEQLYTESLMIIQISVL